MSTVSQTTKKEINDVFKSQVFKSCQDQNKMICNNCMSTLKKTISREINSDFENEVYYVLENYSDNARDYENHTNFIWYFDELDYILNDMTEKYSNNKGIQTIINLYHECLTELMFKNVEKIKEGSVTVQKWIDEIADLQSCMNTWLEKDAKEHDYEQCNIFFEYASE